MLAEESVWPIQSDGRPQRMKAIIREDECIGCTKCISACPVDAIIGSGKLMHSILTDLCTGCELCIPPCPVDCIDLIEDDHVIPNETLCIREQNDLRNRYYSHIQREEQRRTHRKGPVVRANIDTALFAQFSAQNDRVPGTNRYAVASIHQQKLLPQLELSWNINSASDDDYPADFSRTITKTAQRLLLVS